MPKNVDYARLLEEAFAEADVRMTPEHFVRLVAETLLAVRGSRVPTEPASQLTAAEVAELRRGGLAPSADHGAYERVRARTAVQMAALLSHALSTAAAAERMGVAPNRVRRLVSERRLLAARDDGEWRLLGLQFTAEGLVPGIDTVVSALPAGLPPLAAATWLRTPEPELDVAGVSVSPVAWLVAGGDPERVRRLAADL